MTAQICFRFERGGEFTAMLRPDLAPETVKAVMAMLPIETTVYHSRWSGREINFPVKSSTPVPRERQTCSVNTGDVIYWKEWKWAARHRKPWQSTTEQRCRAIIVAIYRSTCSLEYLNRSGRRSRGSACESGRKAWRG